MGSEATLKFSYPVDPREVSSGVKRLYLLDQLTGPWQSISVEPLRDSALCLFILVLGTDVRAPACQAGAVFETVPHHTAQAALENSVALAGLERKSFGLSPLYLSHRPGLPGPGCLLLVYFY